MRLRLYLFHSSKILAYIFLFLNTIIISGCFDAPEDFVAPVWDVNLSIPLINKNYTLGEAIEKDSGLIKSYPPGTEYANQLYFSDLRDINPVEIGDKIRMENTVSFNRSESLGEINVKDPEPVKANLGLSWLSLSPGEVMAVPPLSNIYAGVDFSSTDQFNYLVLSSGSIDLTLTNKLPPPLSLTVSGISLNNDIDSKTVGNYSEQVVIPAGEKRTVTIKLVEGIKIQKDLSFSCRISTPGSQNPVSLPQTSLAIEGDFKNLNVTEAESKIRENNISYNSSFKIDDSTMYKYVEIENGKLRITLENNIDAGVNVKFRLLNIYENSSTGTPYELNLRLERKSNYNESRKAIITDLNGFVLKTNSNELSNEIAYSVMVKSDSTNNYVVIKNTDNIKTDVEMSKLVLRRFSGRLKPTSINLTKTTVSLNLGKWKDKFNFGKIRFKNPDVKFYIKPSSMISARFSGILSDPGTSSKLRFTDDISRVNGQTDTVVSIPATDLAEFFASFTGILPDSLYITGTAIINPGYDNQVYTVSSSDNLSGSAEIKLPLFVGITDGEFKDTTELDLDKNKEDLEKIKAVSVTLEITNGLPAQLKYEGSLWNDLMDIKMLDFPPASGQNGNSIDIPAASVDSKGRVIAPSIKRETIELSGTDVEKFLNSKRALSLIHINTSGSSSGVPVPVEFKTSDAIKVKAFCRFIYRVEE